MLLKAGCPVLLRGHSSARYGAHPSGRTGPAQEAGSDQNEGAGALSAAPEGPVTLGVTRDLSCR